MSQLTLEQKKQKYGEDLLSWYQSQKRDLPWRQSKDPYRIWVSEIMLQQTRVETVIPYFLKFIDKFPTIEKLAEAPEEEVLKCWEGLGYYSRARNLQAGAKMVVEQYEGKVPNDRDAVASLKGVGPYTRGAILSIAFNQPEPAVDGNVMRVLSRYFCLEDDIAKASTRQKIEKLVYSMIPAQHAGDFNQALMDLGATICTPKSPSCLPCPVMEHCEARIQGRELELPFKTKAKKAKDEYRVAIIVEGQGEDEGKILVRQRPEKGLLASMWELPHVLLEQNEIHLMDQNQPKEHPLLAEKIIRLLHEESSLLARPKSWFMDEEHVFSHIHWRMRFFMADTGEAREQSLSHAFIAAEQGEQYETVQPNGKDKYRFVSKEEMKQLPFPNLFIRVLDQYWNERSNEV